MLNHFCKKPLWECTQTLAAVAQGRQPADTVITGARLVNVCTAEVQDDIDVAIAEGRIAYVGQSAAHCIGEGTRGRHPPRHGGHLLGSPRGVQCARP